MEVRKITEKLIGDFKKQMLEEERSRATIEKYMRDIAGFANYVKEDAIDKKVVLSYKDELQKKYAVSSCNSMLAALNSFLRFAGWSDCCVRQFRIQKQAFCREEQELSKGEYMRLIKAAERRGDDRLSLLIQTICGTGIRVSELQYITIESVQKGKAVVSCKAKIRTIFIIDELRKKLLRYAKRCGITEGAIFVTRTGRPMDRSNIWRCMKSLCKEANVSEEKVFPHNLRHLFARTFYGLERDITKLADILGHTNVNTTRIYMISTGEEHRRKMENMGLIDT